MDVATTDPREMWPEENLRPRSDQKKFRTNRQEFEEEADRLAGEIHELAKRLGRNPHHIVDMVKGYVTVRRSTP